MVVLNEPHELHGSWQDFEVCSKAGWSEDSRWWEGIAPPSLLVNVAADPVCASSGGCVKRLRRRNALLREEYLVEE
jgi:hypothetical protein